MNWILLDIMGFLMHLCSKRSHYIYTQAHTSLPKTPGVLDMNLILHVGVKQTIFCYISQ